MYAADWHPVAQAGDGNGGLIISAILLGIIIYGLCQMRE